MNALNENLDWIYHYYIRNPRFKGLFLDYLGKPLLLIFNSGGPKFIEKEISQLKDSHFTVRWMAAQHDTKGYHRQGYWSWMDGSLEPMLTMYNGKPESLTVSVGFFDLGMWLGKSAHGHRGGWTLVESFKSALRHRPLFTQIHQFNEFAGQFEGFGYPPDNVYGDSYSVELSDDFEPVSLTTPAYRGNGGWGFLYLNLTRALVDLYRQKEPETTVVVMSNPTHRQTVTGNSLQVVWTYAGIPARSYTLSLNGQLVARDLQGTSAVIDLSTQAEGPQTLRLTAEGTKSRYLLLHTEDSLPIERPVPAFVEVDFMLKR